MVRLQAETAQFRSDLGKVQSDLANLKGGAASASGGMSSLGGTTDNLRNQMGLLDNTIRGRLPMAMTDVIRMFRDSEVVMKALPFAATAAGFALIGVAVVKAAEAYKEYQQNMEKMQTSLANEFSGSEGLVRNAELTKLHLQDAINKLQGRVSPNGLKEAIIEAQNEAAKLATDVQGTVAKLAESEAMGSNAFTAMFTGKENESALSDKLKQLGAQYALAVAAGAGPAQKQVLQQMIDATDDAIKVAEEHKKTLMNPAFAGQGGGLTSTPQIDQSIQDYNLVKQSLLNLQSVQKQTGVVGADGATAPIPALMHQKAAMEDVAEEIKGNLIPLFSQEFKNLGVLGGKAADEYQTKWMDAFAKQAEEGEKAGSKLKHVWDDLAAEQVKRQDEADKQTLDGQKEYAKEIEDAVSRMTETNLGNYRQMVEGMAADSENLKAKFAGRNAGLSGLVLDAAQMDEDRQSLQQIAAQLQALQDEKQRLLADRDLIAPSDVSNINKYNDAIAQLTKQMATLAEEQSRVMDSMDANKVQSWAVYFQEMGTNAGSVALILRANLQQSVTQFNTSFSEAMSKSIVEGKNFGQAMRQVAAQFLESQIDVLVQWLLKQIEVHTIGRALGAADTAAQTGQVAIQKGLAAQLAGANAVASFSLAPWPIDMGAPAFGASMMASALSFEIGGKIPGSGPVPIMGHGGETVVTKALTDRVERAEGSNNARGGDMHLHNTYAPQVHAMDAEGVDRVLTKHAETFRRHIGSQIRAMNRGR